VSTIQARKQEPKPPTYNFTEPDEKTPKRILAFSGKLGSGKTSCSNFINALAFTHLLQLTPYAFVSDKGELVCQAEEDQLKVVNLKDRSPEAREWLDKFVHPFIRIYSTAEPLKDFCVNFLGLDAKLVWGSQEDKNTLTHLRWENMPDKPKGKSGSMTVRDVMEFVGTNLFRKMDPDSHAKALKNTIDKSTTPYILCDDIRFINEVEVVQGSGGHVVRLTLTTEEAAANLHPSNTELDDFTGFDKVIDNQTLTMEETFGQLMTYLVEIGWFTPVNE
jgi:hypothetical protein